MPAYQILPELSEEFAGWWVFEYNDDDVIVKKTPFRTQEDAEAYTASLRDVEDELAGIKSLAGKI